MWLESRKIVMLIMLNEETDLDFIRELKFRKLVDDSGYFGDIDVDTLYNLVSEMRGDKEKIDFMVGEQVEMVIVEE